MIDLALAVTTSTNGRPYELLATGVRSGLGALFSPSIPAEVHKGFVEYFEQHPGVSEGLWEMSVGRTAYRIVFQPD
jgi:hypothetical protein